MPAAPRPVRSGMVLLGGVLFVALFAQVGADTYWLVALGDRIRESGAVPDGVPFAAADTHGWPNVLVLAEVILSVVAGWGAAGLAGLQLVVDAVALALVVAGTRRTDASDRGTAVALALVILGGLPAFVVVKLQLFSLVPFAGLLLLLRAQHRRPTRAIWLMPVLVAVWTNLHGAVLLGVAVGGAYLLFSRLRIRPIETLLVGPATLLALLATPAGLRTFDYYRDVMGNEAAVRGAGMWARLSLSSPFDVVFMIAAALLLVAALRRRLPVWEYVVLLGLLIATVTASRHGIWLILAAAGPAALGLSRGSGSGAAEAPATPRSGTRPAVTAGSLGALAGVVLALLVLPQRDAETLGGSPALVAEVVGRAEGRVVLAPEPLVESLVAAGMTAWACNPIDAFDRDVQMAYLDFSELGDPERAIEVSDGAITAIVVEKDSDAARSMDRRGDFERQRLTDDWLLYLSPVA
jgi:hypothetical protein